jgi:hypothetical protein
VRRIIDLDGIISREGTDDWRPAVFPTPVEAGRKDDVDVAILNQATPVLAHEVVRSGQILYEARPGIRTDFELATLRRYVDTEPLRRLQDRRLLERIEEYRHNSSSSTT